MNTIEVGQARASIFVENMQFLFGKLYAASLKNQDKEQYLNGLTEVLRDLTDQQFQQGLKRSGSAANTHGFCPTIQQFRRWCMEGFWWKSGEAWRRCCDWDKQSPLEYQRKPEKRKRITTLSYYAWETVRDKVLAGKMEQAERSFIETYDTLLFQAQEQGKVQEWHKETILIGDGEPVENSRADQKSFLPPTQIEWISTRSKELVAGGMSTPMAAMQASKEWKAQEDAAECDLNRRGEVLTDGVATGLH